MGHVAGVVFNIEQIGRGMLASIGELQKKEFLPCPMIPKSNRGSVLLSKQVKKWIPGS
jgi:hypothetical protein